MISQHQGIQLKKPAFSSWHTSEHTTTLSLINPGQIAGYIQQRPFTVKSQASPETKLEGITVRLATSKDAIFAQMITDEMCSSALARSLYPHAKIFSITTGSAVMKMNSRLGFEPVTYGEITKEKKFWEGCKSCVNYQTLLGKNFKNCFCTAMLYNPEEEPQEECETEAEHLK